MVTKLSFLIHFFFEEYNRFISDLQNDTNGSQIYNYFLNQKQISGFNGFVGLGIRELTVSEYTFYCNSAYRPNEIPANDNPNNFTSNFGLKIFGSGCYFYDIQNGRWIWNNMDILGDTNDFYTHCQTSHLTQFAGGFIVLPPQINFEYVFANASFEKNSIIFTTLIILYVTYIILGILLRYKDKIDSNKTGVAFLADNFEDSNYFYEVMVYTGARKESETDSNVS